MDRWAEHGPSLKVPGAIKAFLGPEGVTKTIKSTIHSQTAMSALADFSGRVSGKSEPSVDHLRE